MPTPDSRPVTLLLQRIERGDASARDELFRVLYAELHLRARAFMRRQAPGGTLQATALVHEAFVKLADGTWNDRAHFLVAASQAMRQILVDYARARRAGRVSDDYLAGVAQEFEERAGDIEALQLELERLREEDPAMERAVVLRFYGGVEEEEVARVLELPLRTYQRRWAETKNKLFERLRRRERPE
ncbi:MAG: ECF-type sigma factor [Planctomycetota bacterium]